MKKNSQNRTTKLPPRFTNDIIEDHGDWLLVDISTNHNKNATMAVDSDVFNAHDGGRISARHCLGRAYICASYEVKRKKHLFHRFFSTSDEFLIDHISHGTMSFIDNRRSNLREVTSTQNQMNRAVRNDNTSGCSGVYWNKCKDKWASQMAINGKHKHLGYFTDIKDAIAARKAAEEKYFGEYAFKSGEM